MNNYEMDNEEGARKRGKMNGKHGIFMRACITSRPNIPTGMFHHSNKNISPIVTSA